MSDLDMMLDAMAGLDMMLDAMAGLDTDADRVWLQCTPPHVEPVIWRRVLRKVVVDPRPGGCWWWVGAIADDGYGRTHVPTDGRPVTWRISRLIWTAIHGPVSAGLVVAHHCDESSCARPDHLMVTTQAVNLAMAADRDRTRSQHLVGSADRRGQAARARAIRAALVDGWNAGRLAAALDAGHVAAGQLVLLGAETIDPARGDRDGLLRRRRDRWADTDSSSERDSEDQSTVRDSLVLPLWGSP